MRRRNHLRVDTFPFLAVLLCAMGALILVLLVMDRRARSAARDRGDETTRRAVRERDEAVAARRREQAAREEAVRLAFDRKQAERKARLDAEQSALDAESRAVQARIAEIARDLRKKEESVGTLGRGVQSERDRLGRHEQALASARKESAALDTRVTAGERARGKLGVDLVRLEQVVRDAHAAREREAMTYSVVPYAGKRGEQRQPLYVECTAAGLVFHPDRFALTDPSVAALREEIARRVARLAEQRKQAGMKDETPYLMLLVRPDGVKPYYQVQAAISDLPVEFGYEFVDADWVLAVPAEGKAPLADGRPAAPQGPPPAVPGGPSAPPASRPDLGGSVGLSPPRPLGTGPGFPGASGVGGSNPALPAPGAAPSASTLLPPAPGSFPLLDGAARGPVGVPLPPLGAAVREAAPPAIPSALPGSAAGGGAPTRGLSLEGPPVRGTKGAPQRSAPLLPARVGDPDETVVFVECLSDGVVVYPGGRSTSIEALNHSPKHNPLYQAVEARMAKHRGDPKRRQVRFLIHRDAERTFHLAYPVLNGLGVNKTRYTLQPDDDVARIVAGD